MENVKAIAGYCQPNTAICPRYKVKDELTDRDLLRQVLENQYDIMRALQENVGGHHLGWYPSMGDKITETEALLAKLE